MTREDIDMCEYLRIWGPPEAADRIEALSAEVERNAAIAIRALERATLAEEWRDHDKTRAEAAEAEVARLDAGWQAANAAALSNALDRDAASALAYEAAAEIADLAEHDAEERDWRSGANQADAIAKRIRALATPNQTAALDRVRLEAKAEGMLAAYNSLFKHPGFLHQISGQTFKAVKLEDAAEGILAAIDTQPDPRDAVIARLVEAALGAADAIDMAYDAGGDENPHRHSAELRAAIAAAKGGAA